jgi:hypothetical protein
MPSKRKKKTKKKIQHEAFIPLVFLTFVLWTLYRLLFDFPVIFDELLGKAIFFAVPVFLYVSITGMTEIVETFSLVKMRKGLFKGIAIGGIFGFVAAILAVLAKGTSIIQIPYYFADWFWWEMFLAIITSFWETLFFFSFVMLVIQDKYKQWPLFKQVSLVALIFLIFHIPNTLLRFSLTDSLLQFLLLFVFAYGQALLFNNKKNAYIILITQAIWGMVLLVHF